MIPKMLFASPCESRFNLEAVTIFRFLKLGLGLGLRLGFWLGL